jgi:ceramide glucosyltransferase
LWLAAVVAMLIRAAAAYVVSARVLHARTNLALLPIEDLLGFCFWVAGFFGNTVMWRGRRYRVFADGKFEQVT